MKHFQKFRRKSKKKIQFEYFFPYYELRVDVEPLLILTIDSQK